MNEDILVMAWMNASSKAEWKQVGYELFAFARFTDSQSAGEDAYLLYEIAWDHAGVPYF